MKALHLLLLSALLCVAELLSSQSVLAQFSQQGPKLVGTGAVGSAAQGRSVAISGDGTTAIVGGPSDDEDAGAAWVWTRSGQIWSQQAKLVGTGTTGKGGQGASVSLSGDGNTAIVGGPSDNGNTGAAWIWTRSAGLWTQQPVKLVGSDVVGIAFRGRSVSLSADGGTAIVGGPADNGGAGAAWVWTLSHGVWTQQGAKLVGLGAAGNALQGTAVALSADGSTAIIGGEADDHYAGAAWVWTRNGALWSQQSPKLVGSDATEPEAQGWSASLSANGDTAIVGGPQGHGAAWVWTRSEGVWSQQSGKLVCSDGIGAAQGSSVSLSASGDTALIGGQATETIALAFGGYAGKGAAWIWTRSGGVWSQQSARLLGNGAPVPAEQGSSVSLSADGKTAISGGPGDISGGAVWVFAAPESVSPQRRRVVKP